MGMNRQSINNQAWSGLAPESFGETLDLLFLSGLVLIALIVAAWLAVLLLKRLGIPAPIAPWERGLGRALVATMLGEMAVDGAAVVFYWYAL
ncbi:hypothetical protein FAK_00280 [Desulfoferula mesophila]|uniref:Uncharacterized protein n=2 Tax=Desulfoferula mesophila TaxID=3058419 RepID=A0AAU9EVQ3_9BACT|nr:hypothetical protein FAK_00280 [Desulfoferula mesophilus]